MSVSSRYTSATSELDRLCPWTRDLRELLVERLEPGQDCQERGVGYRLDDQARTFRSVASWPGSSRSRGILTAWLRPFRKTRT